MRVDASGLLVAVVHVEPGEGARADGTPWRREESFTALLSQSFDARPMNVRLSAAQAAELSNPELFGARITVSGTMRRGDFGQQVLECSRFDVLTPGAQLASVPV